MYFTILTLPTNASIFHFHFIFSSLTLFTIVVYIFFALVPHLLIFEHFSQNLNSVKKFLAAGAGCQLFDGKI